MLQKAQGLQSQVLQGRNTHSPGGGEVFSELRGILRNRGQVRGEGGGESESGCICAPRVVHNTENPKKRGGSLFIGAFWGMECGWRDTSSRGGSESESFAIATRPR